MRFSLRNVLALLGIGIMAGAAGAGVNSASIPTIEARNTVFGDANGAAATDVPTYGGVRGAVVGTDVGIVAGTGTALIPIFWESDDTGAYTGPTGATIDTGTEACAVFGLACGDTYIFAVAGASGDEFTDSACSTDQTDDVLSLSFCY